MLDFSPQQIFFTGPLSAKYHACWDQKAQDAAPNADPHPLEDSRGVTDSARQGWRAWVGPPGPRASSGRALAEKALDASWNTDQVDDTVGGTGALTGKIQLSPATERSQVELGLRPSSMQSLSSRHCRHPAHTPPGLIQTAALSRENLLSFREPSLIATLWSVQVLCLSRGTGLIRPGHNFLMVLLPPPSDWEFLLGVGTGHQALFPAGAQHQVQPGGGPERESVRSMGEGRCLGPQPSDVWEAEADVGVW